MNPLCSQKSFSMGKYVPRLREVVQSCEIRQLTLRAFLSHSMPRVNALRSAKEALYGVQSDSVFRAKSL